MLILHVAIATLSFDTQPCVACFCIITGIIINFRILMNGNGWIGDNNAAEIWWNLFWYVALHAIL